MTRTLAEAYAKINAVAEKWAAAQRHVDDVTSRLGRHSSRGCPPGTCAMCEHHEILENRPDLFKVETEALVELHDEGAVQVVLDELGDSFDDRVDRTEQVQLGVDKEREANDD